MVLYISKVYKYFFLFTSKHIMYYLINYYFFAEDQTQESVIQNAIDNTGEKKQNIKCNKFKTFFCKYSFLLGFGKFNFKVAAIGAAIYTNAVINILSVGFILPAAVCDFKMTTIDKGRIAIAHVVGTLNILLLLI